MTTPGHDGPPQMSDQLNDGATFEITQPLKAIHIIYSHIHSSKADVSGNDYDSLNYIRGPSEPNVS